MTTSCGILGGAKQSPVLCEPWQLQRRTTSQQAGCRILAQEISLHKPPVQSLVPGHHMVHKQAKCSG